MSLPGEYVEVNGARIYWKTSGSGEPLLLLHGGMSSTEDFDQVMPDLAKHFRTIAFDRTGHGRSPDSREPFHYATMAAQTAAFIGKLGLGQVNLAGWSDGAIISLLLAITYPGLVRRVVSVSGSIRPDGLSPRALEFFRSATPESFRAAAPELVTRYCETSPDGPSHYLAMFEKTKRMWLEEPDINGEQLSKIKAPVLVVAADRDMISIEHTLEIFRGIQKAQLFVVPGATHSLFSEKPGLVVNAMLGFLQSQAG